jgi:hypothetical protein
MKKGVNLRKKVAAVALLGVLAALFGQACGSDGPPGGLLGSGSGGPNETCDAGGIRSCHVTLGEHNGIVTCFEGTQACVDGYWGECSAGEVRAKRPKGPTPYALSTPEACINNPCDPTCMLYDEVPSSSIDADGTDAFTWLTGDPDNPPPGTITEACSDASDCQANHYCNHPTSGTCVHSKCETGTALTTGCDPCVDRICAADSSCCSSPVPCASIYGASPGYIDCGGTDTYCDMNVSFTGQSCAQMCAAGGGTCIDAWDNSGTCGLSTDFDCDYTGSVAAICRCTRPMAGGSWDQDCVDAVHTQCGAFCSTSSPPDESAQCQHWIPGDTDPNCSGIDLTVDPTCTGTIPVCNVGNSTAPTGIPIGIYPPGTNGLGLCDPAGAGLTPVSTCVTGAPIPPGECISVTSCGAIANGAQIMINRPGTGAQAECYAGACLNNWSVYQSAASCQLPDCSGSTSIATFQRINMFIQFDKSGSMATSGMWTPAVNALTQFFQDPESAGFNVAMRFWPDDSPTAGCNITSCSINACADPLVDLGTLTADTGDHLGGTDVHEGDLVQELQSKVPGGNTPTYPALGGALQWAIDYSLANPLEQQAVLFITDGDPNGCNNNQAQITALAANAYNNYGVLTYVIGIVGATESFLDGIATAGGTGEAIMIGTGNPQAELLAALKSVQGEPVSCNIALPAGGAFNFAGSLVSYYPGDGTSVSIPRVDNAAACTPAGGWYYDSNTNPTEIILCPATCTLATGDSDICNGTNEYLSPSNRHCYLRETASATWANAQTACLAWGGQLATITSAAEQNYIQTYINPGFARFIGGRDTPTEGTWNWVTGETWSYTNWGGGLPNGGAGQNCLEFNSGGLWDDEACSTVQRYFCEKPTSQKSVVVNLDCPDTFASTSYCETYNAVCPPGSGVQWGFFAYDTFTPLDASVTFQVRTAATESDLSSSSFVTAAVAHSTPTDTQVCTMTGPLPDCPVDLFETLGGLPAAEGGALELCASLSPSSDTFQSPLLDSWQITYSCPPNE